MRNLGPRIARLEQIVGEVELPNGGVLVVVAQDGETPSAAVDRRMKEPDIAALGASARQRLVPVVFSRLDLGTL